MIKGIVWFVFFLFMISIGETAVMDLFNSQTTGRSSWHFASSIDGGACSIRGTASLPFPNTIAAAIDVSLFDGSAVCGLCVMVKPPPAGPTPVPGTTFADDVLPPNGEPKIVYVVDSCGGCDAGEGPGFDWYSPSGGSGVWYTDWIAVDCPVGNEKISYETEGSNQDYIKLQIRGHRVPIQSVQIISPQTVTLTRTSDNHWTGSPSSLAVPFTISFMGINSETLTDIVPWDGGNNGVVLTGTGVQFSPWKPVNETSDGTNDGTNDGSSDENEASIISPIWI